MKPMPCHLAVSGEKENGHEEMMYGRLNLHIRYSASMEEYMERSGVMEIGEYASEGFVVKNGQYAYMLNVAVQQSREQVTPLVVV
jgi:hypothetical protein